MKFSISEDFQDGNKLANKTYGWWGFILCQYPLSGLILIWISPISCFCIIASGVSFLLQPANIFARKDDDDDDSVMSGGGWPSCTKGRQSNTRLREGRGRGEKEERPKENPMRNQRVKRLEREETWTRRTAAISQCADTRERENKNQQISPNPSYHWSTFNIADPLSPKSIYSPLISLKTSGLYLKIQSQLETWLIENKENTLPRARETTFYPESPNKKKSRMQINYFSTFIRAKGF